MVSAVYHRRTGLTTQRADHLRLTEHLKGHDEDVFLLTEVLNVFYMEFYVVHHHHKSDHATQQPLKLLETCLNSFLLKDGFKENYVVNRAKLVVRDISTEYVLYL